MNKKIIIIMFTMGLILTLLGCIEDTENNPNNLIRGIKIIDESEKILIAKDDFYGISIKVNSSINLNDIIYNNDNNLLILNKNENSTIISIVSKKDKIKTGDTILTINNMLESFSGELIKTINSINTTENIESENKLLGDLNNDDIVNQLDLNIFSTNYLSSINDYNYNEEADIFPGKIGEDHWDAIYSQNKGDRKIDLNDFVIFTKNYEKEKPKYDEVFIENIKISGDKVVYEKNSILLTAVITYSDGTSDSEDITWKSSNKDYATVNNGIVTGIDEGNLVIFASKNDFEESFFISVKKEIIIIENYITKIEITGENNIIKGEKNTLLATVTFNDASSNNNAFWVSSNEDVAIINPNGEITALKEGTTIINAYKDNKYSEDFKLTVTKEAISITNIIISGENIVSKGNPLHLSATINYSDNSTSNYVNWSSSNKDIATIDNYGNVTALKEGSTTITAEKNNKYSKDFKLTITKEKVSITNIVISDENIVSKGSSLNLSATVNYSDNSTSNNVNWSSSNNDIATIDNYGNVTALKEGSTTITAEKDNKQDTKIITVEAILENGISLYIQEGFANAIHAWIRTSTDTPVFSSPWPGANLEKLVGENNDEYKVTKQNDVYQILFKNKDSVYFILTNNGAKLTDEVNIKKDIYYTSDGKSTSTNPFDYRPLILINPKGGEQKGEKEISIKIIGDGITDTTITFNDEEINISDDHFEFLLSDYLNQGESGQLVVSSSNSEGTKTENFTFKRNDNKKVNVIEAYGTLDPFAKEAIYFLMTDRFVNGDSGNDYKNQGTFDQRIGSANIGYLGGDFKGIYNNADYIKEMGFGAVWITPIVDNPDKVFDGGSTCNEGASPGSDKGKTGYHGYWANNFYTVDEHLVSSNLGFKEYTDKMREKGLKTVLDIVCNHASPAFSMSEELYRNSKFGKLYNENGDLVAESMNQTNGHEWFKGNDQLAQLADFNPNNEEVFQYLSNAQLKWIEEGADAFRIDTVKHLPMEWWKRFVDKMRVKKPGMYMFGEHYDVSSGKMGEYQEKAGMDTLDFPGKYAMQDAFGGNGGYDGLKGYLHLDDGVIKNPYTAATFYDNHDMPRMNASDEGFIDAHNWLFTTRGIPVLYYGSEMGFQRGKKEHSGNRNYYGEDNISTAKNSSIYKELVKIGNIRKNNIALQKGLQINLDISGKTASFYRIYQHENETQTALVLLNKGDSNTNITVSDYISSGDWTDAETGEIINVSSSISKDVPAHGFKILLFNEAFENDDLLRECERLMNLK